MNMLQLDLPMWKKGGKIAKGKRHKEMGKWKQIRQLLTTEKPKVI